MVNIKLCVIINKRNNFMIIMPTVNYVKNQNLILTQCTVCTNDFKCMQQQDANTHQNTHLTFLTQTSMQNNYQDFDWWLLVFGCYMIFHCTYMQVPHSLVKFQKRNVLEFPFILFVYINSKAVLDLSRWLHHS